MNKFPKKSAETMKNKIHQDSSEKHEKGDSRKLERVRWGNLR